MENVGEKNGKPTRKTERTSCFEDVDPFGGSPMVDTQVPLDAVERVALGRPNENGPPYGRVGLAGSQALYAVPMYAHRHAHSVIFAKFWHGLGAHESQFVGKCVHQRKCQEVVCQVWLHTRKLTQELGRF